MDEYSETAVIVFPSNYPKNVDDAHCTLIYLGRIPDLSYTKEDVMSVLDRLKIKAPGEIETKDLEYFGKDKDVLVLTLDSSRLLQIRSSMERALAKIGAENASEFKEYKPHVSLGTKEDEKNYISIPDTAYLESPQLWWGNDIN